MRSRQAAGQEPSLPRHAFERGACWWAGSQGGERAESGDEERARQRQRTGSARRGHNKCEHNHCRNICKNCGGTSICQHNRRRSACKNCGGASICQHNRRRSACKNCGGASICQHNRQRSRCTDRGDASALAGHLRNGWVYVSSVQAGGTAPWNDTSIRTKCFTLTTLCGIMVPLWCRERRCIRHTWVLLSRCIREV